MKIILRKINTFLNNPKTIFIKLLYLTNFLWSDKFFLQILYYVKFGKILNLKNPKTFNEKLNWIKLYDHNPLYNILVDKYEVKKWVKDRIGEEFIIPTYGVWNSPDDIDWDYLPSQFVIKTTNGGGNDGVFICKDKSLLNKEKITQKIKKAMNTNPYKRLREWPYKNVKPRILAEKYIESIEKKELLDFKFFAFNGVVKAMYIASDRQTIGEEAKTDYFDADFNNLNIVQSHPVSNKKFSKPTNFDKMKELASVLSKGISEVRCDFYEVDGNVYFGEMTLMHAGGMCPFQPEIFDYEWGKWIELPTGKRI